MSLFINYGVMTGGTEKILSYYGTAPALTGRGNLAATPIGDYAIFGGGRPSGTIVEAYSSSLVKSSLTSFTNLQEALAATSVGNYALFGGGQSTTARQGSKIVHAYNTSLVHSLPTELFYYASVSLAATTIGNYALFGGGYYTNKDDDDCEGNYVDAYNTSLVRTNPTKLSRARSRLAATSVGDYALFGGGYGSAGDKVDAYNSTLVRSTPTALSELRSHLAATTIGDYALFGGGHYYSNYSAVVDAYNSTLVRSTPTALSVVRSSLAATTIGDYALFGGGIDYSNNILTTVNVYNSFLVRTNTTGLVQRRWGLAATTIGNYALFGGGYYEAGESYYSGSVDVYQVS